MLTYSFHISQFISFPRKTQVWLNSYPEYIIKLLQKFYHIFGALHALLRHSMRRAHQEAVELCHDIEIIVATKQKTKNKKIVATYDHSGRKMLSRHFNLCRDKRREEALNVHWDNVVT